MKAARPRLKLNHLIIAAQTFQWCHLYNDFSFIQPPPTLYLPHPIPIHRNTLMAHITPLINYHRIHMHSHIYTHYTLSCVCVCADIHTHPLITSEVCADACLFQLLHLGVNFFRCLTSLRAKACSLCKCFFWTSPYLCRLVKEQITCLHKKSTVLHILLCLVYRSPFEDGPCYFPSPCSSPGMQIIIKWNLKKKKKEELHMYCGCSYQHLHKLHTNQARITHHSKGLQVKGWLIANWVARSEAGLANKN